MRFALFLLRAVIGVLFIGHGAQKVLGKFGGYGPEGTGQFFDSIGLRPGKAMALAAGGTEMGGGALLTLGLATPAAQAGLTSVMAAAVWTVHKDKGIWVTEGGYEYNLVLVSALFAITACGPGALSLDEALDMERTGLGWALLGLLAGIGGAAAILTSSQGDAGEAPPAGGPEAQEAPAGAAPAAA
jgi:putative oxidoreductase